MKLWVTPCLALSMLLVSGCSTDKDKLVLADQSQLTAIKQSSSYQDSIAWQQLNKALQQDLAMKPLNVTLSDPLLPSGNPHDYYSVGPYWWPNPDTEDGLPWLKRDGERNYQFRGDYSDNRMFTRLSGAIFRLSLGYHYTEKKQYAQKLQTLVKAWFLDPNTAMTPHLEFGQGVPGVANGRPFGIIEIRHLLLILDGVTLTSQATDKVFQQEFSEWARKFLTWLTTSKIGLEQKSQHNNHGAYYDALVAGLHLYLGETESAIKVFETTKTRIVEQINEQGQQPHELDRTRPYHYSAFNLLAFTQIASMAEKVNIDLWHYPSHSDARILKAFSFLLGNANNQSLWQGKSEPEVILRHMVVPALRVNSITPVNFDAIIEHSSSHQELTMCQLLFDTKVNIKDFNTKTASFACTL